MTVWRRWFERGGAAVGAAVVAAVALVGVAAEQRSIGLGDPSVWLPDVLVGVVIAAVGAALANRGYNVVGALMIAAGLTWFAGNLRGERAGWIAWASGHLILVHRAFIFVAVLAFPIGLARRRAGRVVAAAAFAGVLPDAARDEWWTAAWAIAVFIAFVVLVRGRTASLRVAGLHVLPVMAVFALVLVATAVMRWTLGDSPPTRTTVLVYQAGMVVTAVYLLERAVDWRRRPAELADAVVEVTLGPGGNVRALLSRALRDPSVAVAFATRVNGDVAWFDESGRPVPRLSTDGGSVVPIMVGGEPIAEVASSIDFESAPTLLAAVASATRLAAKRARLRADLRAQIELLSASRRRLLSVADEERVALAAQLEREAGQTMQQIRMLLERIALAGDAGVDEAVRRSMERLDGLDSDFASLVAGLGPVALSHGRLDDALDRLATGGAMPVSLAVNCPIADMSPAVASTLYFVCAEAIANTTKHADATAVGVTLDATSENWVIRVDDDGRGGADPSAGSGLSRLADRVGALGGRLYVDSPAGSGTRLTAEVPRG